MLETTFDPTPLQRIRQQSYRHHGCVVVHESGEYAGLLEIEISLPDFLKAEEADLHVQLLLSSEFAPLRPIQTLGSHGHFRFLFYSPSIAETGSIPFEAAVYWETEAACRRRNLMLMPFEFANSGRTGQHNRHSQVHRRRSFGPPLIVLGGIVSFIYALSILI